MKALKSKQGWRCPKCFNPSIFAPLLVESGYSRSRDMKCPICNRMFDSITGNEYKKEPKVDPNEGWSGS